MKSKNVVLVCLIILAGSLTAKAQDSSRTGMLHKIYLRIGFTTLSFNNENSYSRFGNTFNFMTSVSYDYSKNFQIDLMYMHYSDLSRYLDYKESNDGIRSYGYTKYQAFGSNLLSLKVNYFISKQKELNPFYVTGGIAAAIQPVHNVISYFDIIHDPSNYVYNYSASETENYRILLGPELGIGMFLAFGRVNFQSEFTYSARFSPFIDRNYRELSFSLFNGLVYKF